MRALINAQDIAPVAWATIVASALGEIDQNSEGSNWGGGAQGVGLRSLVVFPTRPHYHIGRRRLRRHRLIVSVIAALGFLEEAH